MNGEWMRCSSLTAMSALLNDLHTRGMDDTRDSVCILRTGANLVESKKSLPPSDTEPPAVSRGRERWFLGNGRRRTLWDGLANSC